MKLKIGIILVFLGSVLLTSEKFIDAENAIKFYFTVFAVFIGLILLLLWRRNNIIVVKEITSFLVMKGLFIVGVFQATYGVLQYMGKYPSNHNSFAVTGSFENPAGFVAVLSLLFPIGIFWCLNSKNIEQRVVFFFLGLVLFSIILSGSRTGIVAISRAC
jgi:O-antigen polymerase